MKLFTQYAISTAIIVGLLIISFVIGYNIEPEGWFSGGLVIFVGIVVGSALMIGLIQVLKEFLFNPRKL